MISFVDAYRDKHGVKPFCKVLPIAPRTLDTAIELIEVLASRSRR